MMDWDAWMYKVREYEERTFADWMDEGYRENDDEILGDESDEYDRI